MGTKPADQDILGALSFIEDEIEIGGSFSDDPEADEEDGEHVKQLRRLEVLLKRLAREAGYKLPAA